ncbi:MAG: hypothetical protein JOY59_01525, partial [Candidatus Eremiobacteraeota bacterium]|nr:hypothetical protein [Candidatus Eremiobacteraeota bacterium]
YRRPRFTLYVLPCRLGVWNEIPVDLSAIAHDTDFLMTPGAKMRFSVIAAVHENSIREITGDFGGISDVVRPRR